MGGKKMEVMGGDNVFKKIGSQGIAVNNHRGLWVCYPAHKSYKAPSDARVRSCHFSPGTLLESSLLSASKPKSSEEVMGSDVICFRYFRCCDFSPS